MLGILGSGFVSPSELNMARVSQYVSSPLSKIQSKIREPSQQRLLYHDPLQLQCDGGSLKLLHCDSVYNCAAFQCNSACHIRQFRMAEAFSVRQFVSIWGWKVWSTNPKLTELSWICRSIFWPFGSEGVSHSCFNFACGPKCREKSGDNLKKKPVERQLDSKVLSDFTKIVAILIPKCNIICFLDAQRTALFFKKGSALASEFSSRSFEMGLCLGPKVSSFRSRFPDDGSGWQVSSVNPQSPSESGC